MMNTKPTHLRTRFAWVTCLVGLLLLPSWSVAVSEDLKEIIKQYYQKAEFKTANDKLLAMLKDNQRTADDRQFILIYLALIALAYKEADQPVDNYLCQLLSEQPGFDPEFSSRDITAVFKEAFNRLKAQNLCFPLDSYEPEVKNALVDKKCDRIDQLLVKWEVLLPPSSPKLEEVKKWREQIQSSRILKQCSLNEPSSHPDEPSSPPPTTSCGVIRFRVENLLTKECQPLLKAKKYIAAGPTKTIEGTALECYQKAQQLCPDEPKVREGFADMENFYVEKTNKALQAKQFDRAKGLLNNLKAVNPQSPAIKDFELKLQKLQ